MQHSTARAKKAAQDKERLENAGLSYLWRVYVVGHPVYFNPSNGAIVYFGPRSGMAWVLVNTLRKVLETKANVDPLVVEEHNELSRAYAVEEIERRPGLAILPL